MPTLSELAIYPVKSCAGIGLTAMSLDRFGPAGDRRWMVVDGRGRFLSQREHTSLALLRAVPEAGGMRLSTGSGDLYVPLPTGAGTVNVTVWSDSAASSIP